MHEHGKFDLRWAWLGALGVFVLAGSTGALYRFGMPLGLPFGLQFGNVRHAHSHLMLWWLKNLSERDVPLGRRCVNQLFVLDSFDSRALLGRPRLSPDLVSWIREIVR